MEIISKINFNDYINKDAIKSYEFFLHRVNEKWEKQYGLRDTYDNHGDNALAEDIEYFGQWITADDRMRYIIENIVAIPDSKLSPVNKICNTIISHFYGARGIHQIVTNIKDPKKAHVDFERLFIDDSYLNELKINCEIAKKQKKKFYGTTELHTSLQTAARNYCRIKYNDPTRPASITDILEWIASWINDGTIEKILEVDSLKGMFNILTSKNGVGEYYGYHCATSNSVNYALPFHHDEEFCAPGPGARESLDNIFSLLKSSGKFKKMPYGDLVIWIRENQEKIFDHPIKSHTFFHNYITDTGIKVFEDDQDELKVYTTEVSLCQFGVYCYLKKNPHLISKRKIARLEDDSVCDLADKTQEEFLKKILIID
ncbi:MAG: putative DNA base hypermodification protein [Candidatus Woesearchaeota archaeon]